MKWISPSKLSTLIIALLFSDVLMAQVLPGPVLPEQVGRAIKQQEPEAPAPSLPELEEKKAPPGVLVGEKAKKIMFQLNGIKLVGNTVYSEAQLRHLYQDKVGKRISIAQLFEIVQSITNYYRNNGYILSRAIIPPQHVKNGHVKIQIIEGFIDEVQVTGKPYGACCLIQMMGNRIKACPPLKMDHMEKYLYLMNEIPATRVKAVISASKKTTGGADLSLVTEHHPVTGFLTFDNYGTRYIGPNQLGAHLQLNSILFSGDALAGTLTKTTRWQELTYIDVNYNAALGTEGVRWLLGHTKVKTHPLFVLRPLDIQGDNNNSYTTVYFPIIRSREQQLTLRAGFTYLDSFVDALSLKLYEDKIRSVDVGATYIRPDKWKGINTIHADLRQGLPIFGYSRDTNIATAETSRPGGHAVYTKFFFSANRLQPLKNNFSLFAVLQGQYSFDALLAAEQFTFGGSQLGRGYDAAELIGDKGIAGSLEARYDWVLDKNLIKSIQFYVFYDAGNIWNYHALGDEKSQLCATSAGFGGRFVINKWLSGGVMFAKPLTKDVNAEALVDRGKHPRLFFNLVATFE